MARKGRIDMSRVASAAVDAAFADEQPRRRRLSGVGAVAAGAALATVARVVVKKAPDLLPNAPRLSNLTDSVRDRLADSGWIDQEEPLDEVEEEPLDEVEEDESEWDEPEDEEIEDREDEGSDDEDDEWEDEDDESDDSGPDASGDEDWEDDEEEEDAEEREEDEPAPAIELGTNGGGREGPAGSAPDLMGALSPRRRPPVMRTENELDPAERPPEPPKRQRSSRSKKSKAKAGKK